ncbi:MAG: hypothetical protein RL291_785 [Pseudomonadota bacterium]|jgi:hypothetical protein
MAIRPSMRRSSAAFAVLLLAMSTSPARADAIDGEWCRAGDLMKIDGSTIVTPRRNTIAGAYGRYRFVYVIPAGEPGAGGEIKMVMIRGQGVVHLERPGMSQGQYEVWERCKPVS